MLIHGLKGHPYKTWTAKGIANPGEGHGQKATPSGGSGLSSKIKGLFARRDSSISTAADSVEGEDSPVFWPADLLPTQCPEARVLVFGYDTAIAKRQSAGLVNRNSIFAHGKDLVNELGRIHPIGRPVIFITHSLGGIVLKEVWNSITVALSDSAVQTL